MIILAVPNTYIIPIVTAILGAIAALLLERYKNRIVLLTHTTTYQSLGAEINDPYWGNISVFHDGRNIRHLSFISVIIKNTTRTDAQAPLNLEIWVDNRSKILGYRGHYDTGNVIQFEEKFAEQYMNTSNDLEADAALFVENQEHVMPEDLSRRLKFMLTNRKLTLPIFNRKSSLTVSFLVENIDGVTPLISTTIQQKGVRLIPESDKAKTENYKKIIVGLITLVSYVVGLIWVYEHFPNKQDAITWTIFIGSGSYTLGYGFYYLSITLKKLFW